MPPKVERGFDPIMQKHRENMQSAFAELCNRFPGIGLCLFLFDEHSTGPRANYISNTRREQALSAIKGWVAIQEGLADK
jgi:hypothetical protein